MKKSYRSALAGILLQHPLATPLRHPVASTSRLFSLSHAQSDGNSPNSNSRSSHQHSTSSYLLAHAQAEEEAEQEALDLQRRKPDPNDKPWDGDEPQARALRRILQDQYKPLKIKGYKKAIPQPAPLPSHLFQPTSTPSPASTPVKYPWEVTFKSPDNFTPSIRSAYIPSRSGMTVKLPDRARDRSGARRVEDAATASWDYSAGFRADGSGLPRAGGGAGGRGGAVMVPTNADAYENEVEHEDRKQGVRRVHVPVSMRAWGGFIEDKIVKAREDGLFKNVKGRGKPLPVDDARSNPFIPRDEFLINRIIHSQGTCPPWIEIQLELEAETSSFRNELRAAWVRRAVRMLSLGGVTKNAIWLAQNGWRDAEWEQKERSFHEAAISSLNSLTRRYNTQAPYTVRRSLFKVEKELESCFKDSGSVIADDLKRIMDGGYSATTSVGRGKGGEERIVQIDGFGEERGAVKETMWRAFRRLITQVLGKDDRLMVETVRVK
ncbi:hypothetical protein T439DRAFT_326993 [Meredithblackwellia eburnea MCA 4105]